MPRPQLHDLFEHGCLQNEVGKIYRKISEIGEIAHWLTNAEGAIAERRQWAGEVLVREDAWSLLRDETGHYGATTSDSCRERPFRSVDTMIQDRCAGPSGHLTESLVRIPQERAHLGTKCTAVWRLHWSAQRGYRNGNESVGYMGLYFRRW